MSDSKSEKTRPNPNTGEGGGPKKVQKKYFVSAQPQDGHTGVLVTSDRGREQRCAKEMIDLFDEVAALYFPKLPSPDDPVQEESSEPTTIESELAKELKELKKSRRKQSKRFQVVDSGCSNIVFIRFVDEIDANKFVIKVFEYLVQEVKKPRTRYSNRILPIEKTCFVSEDSIATTISPAIERVFVKENETSRPFKFRVDLKSRYNDKLDKDNMKRRLVSMVGRGHFVDLKTPNKSILVEVFAKAAGVAVIDFDTMELYKNFNIRTVSAAFGLPLPPHPDELEIKKKLTVKASGAPVDAAPSSSSTNSVEKSNEDTEMETEVDKEPENNEQEEDPPVANQGDVSDSDSDNGGISLF